MAEQIIFGKISKKINSTSSAMTNVLTTNVLLKKNTSIVSPVMEIKADFATLRACNYAKYAGFCYYIDNVISKNKAICTVSMHRDPLASFKSYIKNTPAYIKFASELNHPIGIDDTRLSPTPLTMYSETKILTGDGWNINGSVILSTYGWDTNSGHKYTYGMSFNSYYDLIGAMNNFLQSNFDGVSDIKEVFSNAYVKFGGTKWNENIISAIYIPIDFDHLPGTSTTDIWIGGYQQSGSYKLLNEISISTWDDDITLNWPAGSLGAGDHNENCVVNLPKYTEATLVHPCGITSLNILPISAHSTASTIVLNRKFCFNFCTGEYVLRLEQPSLIFKSTIVGEASGSVGIDVKNMVVSGQNAVGIIMPNAIKGASMAGSFLSGIMASKVPAHTVFNTVDTNKSFDGAGDLTGVTSHRETLTEVPEQHSFSSGITGAFGDGGSVPTSINTSNTCGFASVGLYQFDMSRLFTIRLTTYMPELIFRNDYSKFCDKYGYPRETFEDNLPDGYVECANASVSAPCTQSELSMINSYLNTGLYIE